MRATKVVFILYGDIISESSIYETTDKEGILNYCKDLRIKLKNLDDLPATIIDVSWFVGIDEDGNETGGYYPNVDCDDQFT